MDDIGGPIREGSQYHCVHEMGDIHFTITDWNPPHSFESDEVVFGIPVHFTMQVLATDMDVGGSLSTTGSTLSSMARNRTRFSLHAFARESRGDIRVPDLISPNS